MIDLSEWKYAEALYRFCTDGESLDDCEREYIAESDLSFAEYVQKFKLEQFSRYYEAYTGKTISAPPEVSEHGCPRPEVSKNERR